MKIAVVGDPYFPAAVLAEPIRALDGGDDLTLLDIDAAIDDHHDGIREYVGSAREVIALLDDHDALVVHAAPVTAGVLDASPNLALVGCARGGPVNVDVVAAGRRGIPVVTAPGKNAHAVAELTMAFLIMLARRVRPAIEGLAADGRIGESVVEGAAFMGGELRGRTLGLVGYGHVGALLAGLALRCGMEVRAYDPYVSAEAMAADSVHAVAFEALLSGCDFVSLHARATAANENMIGARELAAMRPSAYLVNTARETLVDEDALREALQAGAIAGAAMDVLRPPADGDRHPLLGLPNVIVTPHIGGATVETLRRGAAMVAEDLRRFRSGEPLLHAFAPPPSDGGGEDGEHHARGAQGVVEHGLGGDRRSAR
jgi:D-3-phosphoglycerate dehydrogenase / 2-oxoglutarate reductase